MNVELLEDEDYDVPLPDQTLADRMQHFLQSDQSDFRVFVFQSDDADDKIAGYAVMDTSKRPCYLRQFYIARSNRRHGYGRMAFTQICAELGVDQMDVEVMAWNDAGKQFWRSLGFVHRYEGLRWTSQS